MPVNPQDLFAYSEQAFGSSASEVEYRMVAGRAYYSVYHACDQLHKTSKYQLISPPAKGGLHEQLYDTFKAAHPTRCGAAATQLKRIGIMAQGILRPLRVRADYRLHESFERDDAEIAIEKAREILGHLSSL